jgi:hypothetical protein
MPKKNRIAIKPPKLCAPAVDPETQDQMAAHNGRYRLGRTRVNIMFEGSCASI